MRMMCTMKSNVHPNTCINSVDDEVAMIQHLLDTDLIYDYPELQGLANKFVAEGLCYFVGYISDWIYTTAKLNINNRSCDSFLLRIRSTACASYINCPLLVANVSPTHYIKNKFTLTYVIF